MPEVYGIFSAHTRTPGLLCASSKEGFLDRLIYQTKQTTFVPWFINHIHRQNLDGIFYPHTIIKGTLINHLVRRSS